MKIQLAPDQGAPKDFIRQGPPKEAPKPPPPTAPPKPRRVAVRT
jgi:hypothetical protein